MQKSPQLMIKIIFIINIAENYLLYGYLIVKKLSTFLISYNIYGFNVEKSLEGWGWSAWLQRKKNIK